LLKIEWYRFFLGSLENDEIYVKTADRSESYDLYEERGNVKFERKVRILHRPSYYTEKRIFTR